MKWVKAVLQLVWKIYLFLVVLISLILLYPLYLIFLKVDRLLPYGFVITRFQARLILFFSGISYQVEGSIPRDNDVSYIICPNHTSFVDILVLYAIFPNYFIFLGKKELGKVPLFNIFFKKLNILVDRQNPKGAHEAMLKASSRLDSGTNVVIFPEGTISKLAPKLRPFKNGAFKIASQQNMPIIPVSFLNNHLILEDSMKFGAISKPGKAKVVIHEPIYPDPNSANDLLTLRDKCREAIASAL
jgi:1-acyl-sn-glycerol-3-phosphate acyltransferase